jgi:CRISPR/Cas system-associated endoribonuclease Cas2
MALFTVSYDLNKTKNYQILWDALKKQGAHRILESVWLINTSSTLKEVLNWLKGLVDNDDSLTVIKFAKSDLEFSNAKGGTNDWLNQNG